MSLENNPSIEGLLEGIRPDPTYTVSSWSNENRILTSKASSEPGPYRSDRIPYVRQIMDCLSVHDAAQEIIVMKGAQLGLSEVGNNWIGYIIDAVPGPILAVQPNLDVAKKYSKQRIDSMIEACPKLKAKVAESKSRDSGNTIFSKDFPGGMMVITGANSAAGLRSMPIRFLFLDEIDGYVKNVEKEGSPIKLAEARTSTYDNKKKIYKISTPTVDGASEIQKQYEKSSKERFFVPCVHCDFMQVLEWEQIRYDPGKERETVCYECIECGNFMFEHDKTEMFSRGEWRAERPEEIYIRGFHISSLYSPVGWYSWARAAMEYEEAKADEGDELMRSFINTKLGLTFKERGETPDHQRLYERRELYPPRMLPIGSALMTAGMDVQKDRVEISVIAWSVTKEKWLVDYHVCQGDVEQDDVWDEAEEYLNQEFMVAGSLKRVKISGIAIDSGFAQPRVAAFARRFPRTRMFMIKGQSPSQVALGSPRQLELKINGQKMKTALRIWNVGVDILKSELFRQLLLPMPEDGQAFPKGFFHFHQNLSLDWFQGLCSEELRSKKVNGFTVYFFHKTIIRNEPLDTYVYARAAYMILGCDRWSQTRWETVALDLSVDENASLQVETQELEVETIDVKPMFVPKKTVNEPPPAPIQARRVPPTERPRRKSRYWT